MNLAEILLYPLMLLLPATGVRDIGQDERVDVQAPGSEPIDRDLQDVDLNWPRAAPGLPGSKPLMPFALSQVEPSEAWQIRIEQRMTIRISPRMPAPDNTASMAAIDRSRYVERKIGKCIPVAAIAGVQPDGQRNLLLFMRDRRLMTVELERACRAGAFYSGFLLSRSTDGLLCVNRDTLLSRSGTNCKLTRIRQLVAGDN